MSVNLPASLRSTMTLLRTVTADQNTALRRLATGEKVGSAIDGPDQFFKARALDQRAGDLDALKSGIAQAISSIKAAAKGVDAVKALMDQARGLTTSALSSLDDTPLAIETRRNLAEHFNLILDKVDAIVGDSSYQGKNLLYAKKASYAATDDSLRAANQIDGVTGVSMTGVTSQNDYRIQVTGSGEVSGNAADTAAANEALGLASLQISGINSIVSGRMDNIRFELHGKPGRDAKVVVLDGDESWTTTLTHAQLVSAAESSTQIELDHTFSSGARIDIAVDGNVMQAALQPSGLVKAEVRRDVDLQIEVTDNRGISQIRSGTTQDDGSRLRGGENSFRFDQGTVRLTIDPATLQGSASFSGGIIGDLGGLDDLIVRGRPKTVDQPNSTVRLEVEKLGFGANNMALNQYYSSPGGTTGYETIPLAWAGGTLGGPGLNASRAEFAINPTPLVGATSNGTFIVNRNPGQGGLTTVADGNWDNGEFTNPFVRGWNNNAELTVTYGATVNGSRAVSVNDGIGGTFSGIVADQGNGRPSVITISGGSNSGATIGLFYKDDSAGSRKIEVYVNQASRVTADDPQSLAQIGSDDIPGWYGFSVDTAVTINVGAADSGGVGQRDIVLTQRSLETGQTSSETLRLANNNLTNVTHMFSSGPNIGGSLRFDAPSGGGTLNYRVAAMDSALTRAGEVIIQSRSQGQAATISTRQVGAPTAENDLKVKLGTASDSILEIKAVRVDSGAEGLGIDRAANGWHDRADVAVAIQDLTQADGRLQSGLRTLQVNMDILGTRQDFTEEFTNVLRAGARELVASDTDEEGASVLTANVRSQLATTMLSLMAQQQQRIVSLF